ncbi:MAG: hypothetical protein ACR2IE_03090 [Candidatus Sumerlaeaceae bacterium]
MDFFVTPDHIINLSHIAYVERQGGQPQVVIIYFSALTSGPGGEPQPFTLTLRGADADLLLQRLTRKPGEDEEMRWT